MFYVKHKDGKGLIQTVYAIDDTRGLWFLTYDKDNGWYWIDGNLYEPYVK